MEVDVDTPGDAALAAALKRFGPTPVTIRTASGKSKAWYRYSGEGRIIRIGGSPTIDILGARYTIVPPSVVSELGTFYKFLTGSISDLRKLPPIRSESLVRCLPPQTVIMGHRNQELFRFLAVRARSCDDIKTLMDEGTAWVSELPDPLDHREIERTAKSAWRYRTEGRNFVGLKHPQVDVFDKIMDELIDKPRGHLLWVFLHRNHKYRPEFAIAPTSMSKTGKPP